MGRRLRPAVLGGDPVVSGMEYVRTQGVVRRGELPRALLYAPAHRLFHARLARGVYGTYHRLQTRTAIAACRVPQGVLCLESALYVHGLGQQPPETWLAIGPRARMPHVPELPVRCVRFSGEALVRGIEWHSLGYRAFRTYSVAKTVADLFKFRHKVGVDVAERALREAFARGLCTELQVWHWARICRVTAVLQPQLEALRRELARHRPVQVSRRWDAIPWPDLLPSAAGAHRGGAL